MTRPRSSARKALTPSTLPPALLDAASLHRVCPPPAGEPPAPGTSTLEPARPLMVTR